MAAYPPHRNPESLMLAATIGALRHHQPTPLRGRLTTPSLATQTLLPPYLLFPSHHKPFAEKSRRRVSVASSPVSSLLTRQAKVWMVSWATSSTQNSQRPRLLPRAPHWRSLLKLSKRNGPPAAGTGTARVEPLGSCSVDAIETGPRNLPCSRPEKHWYEPTGTSPPPAGPDWT